MKMVSPARLRRALEWALAVRPLREAAYQRARLAEAARGYLRRGNLQPATSTVCHAAVEARAAGDEGYAGTGWLLSETAY